MGLYAGADAWMHLMEPVVEKKKDSVVQATSVCLNTCTAQSFDDDDQEYVLTGLPRRSA